MISIMWLHGQAGDTNIFTKKFIYFPLVALQYYTHNILIVAVMEDEIMTPWELIGGVLCHSFYTCMICSIWETGGQLISKWTLGLSIISTLLQRKFNSTLLIVVSFLFKLFNSCLSL